MSQKADKDTPGDHPDSRLAADSQQSAESNAAGVACEDVELVTRALQGDLEAVES